MKSIIPLFMQVNSLLRRQVYYVCFFLTGFTALIFEVLWSRQFVTVFGNSSYAVSIVLCAYMAGLGLGGIFGGMLSDRIKNPSLIYAVVLTLVAVWAMIIPYLLDYLRIYIPTSSLFKANYLWINMVIRFIISFIILGVPCFFMGTTLPLLMRTLSDSEQSIKTGIGMLYGLNTIGAAIGCLAAGFYLIQTFGLFITNITAVIITLTVAGVMFIFSTHEIKRKILVPNDSKSAIKDARAKSAKIQNNNIPGWLFVVIAFFNGMTGLACEVLWMRYIAFIDNVVYVFPTVLSIYLLGIGIGSLIFRMFSGQIRRPIRILILLEIILAVCIPVTFVICTFVFSMNAPRPFGTKTMAMIIIFIPTILMGVIFPILCSLYSSKLQTMGRFIGRLYAVNTAGTVIGSLLPIFILIPILGIQKSLFLMSVLCGILGILLLIRSKEWNYRQTVAFTTSYVIIILLLFTAVPSKLCQKVFLASSPNLVGHTDILSYHEGRTGTAIITNDNVNNCKTLYVNGTSEVPVLYSHKLCFKMIGDLGPLLHPSPDDVLMICFGGGIAAGATSCLPEVKSLTIVDMENSVVESAKLFSDDNNNLHSNPKVNIVIDDGRNYIMTSQKKWPVIISDSTHPKSSDSWVLYTQEFYRIVKNHLTTDGIFVQWLPVHGLTTAELKIILRTFQATFPHTSMWVTHGLDEQDNFTPYTLLVATSDVLKIDVEKLEERLGNEIVSKDLKPYGLHTTAGFLSTFLCSENKLRIWAGRGVINTDNLPYTQYNTVYSKGVMLDYAEPIELMEDISPYLTNTGPKQKEEQLLARLGKHATVTRLALLGRLKEAYSSMPDDIRYSKTLQLFKEGPKYIEKLQSIYWDNPKILSTLANNRLNGPNGEEAVIPIYRRILELDPNNCFALNNIAIKHMRDGNLPQAESSLRKAVRIKPDYAYACFNLGQVLNEIGQNAEAVKYWKEATLDPEFEDGAKMLGIYNAEKGRLGEAILWFRQALKIKPSSIEIRLCISYALFQTGNIEEGIHHLKFVLKLDPENEIALEIIAQMNGQKVSLL